MGQPRRTPRLRDARSVLNTLSLSSPRSALNDDVPQVLERSMRRIQDVKQRADVMTGPGILVKLYAVPPEDAQSVDSSEPTMWFVGAPNATKWTPRKSANAHEANAIVTKKASHAAGAGSASKSRVKALNSGKAGRQKEQRSLAKGKRNVAKHPVQEGHSESDDTSDEQEEEDEEEEEEEDYAGEADAGEDEDLEEEEAGEDDIGEDGELDEEAVVDDKNGHDGEEHDGDGHNKASEETETEEVGETQDEEHESGRDLADSAGEEGEQEAEAQPQEKEQQEAEKVGETEGEEKAADEAVPHVETRGKDCAVPHGEDEEHGGDGEAGKGRGTQDQVQGAKDATGQRVTTKSRDGPWRSWKLGDTRGEEGEERCTNAAEEERTLGDENGCAEETRKRASACSTPEERPNKRRKGDRDCNEDDAATNDSLSRTYGLKTQSRPRTPSLKSTTPTPPSTIEIVRQISVVPGLEATESAVWDAARTDAAFASLSEAGQKKMVCTAVSLASEKGIKELQRFVYDARRNLKQKGKSLEYEFDLSAFQPDADTRDADGTLIPRDSGLARFSVLYQQIKTLDNAVIKLSVTRRVKLAAMAQYRNGLVKIVAGRNQVKDANLHLFRAIHPEHATFERPDKARKSLVLDDWTRMCDRLREGNRWLDIREHFGGAGAFLALLPQCVSNKYVQKMQVERFGSWLRLLDVAWRGLDGHAKLTLNELVRMSLAGQPLPEGFLALEMLEDGTDTALTSLSGMFTGWPASDRPSRDTGTKLIAIATQRGEDSDAAASRYPANTLITPRAAEEAEDMGLVLQKEIVESVEDELYDGLHDLDFDECSSRDT